MRVTANQHQCVAAGQCAALAPHVFDQSDDDGVVIVLDEHPQIGLAESVRQAAAACPALAIDVEE